MRTDPTKAWFAPKRYGYGAGLPKVVSNPAILLAAICGIALLSTIALVIICAKTTKGGWHWRWGGKP